MFSSYYAWNRIRQKRKGLKASPYDHPAVNAVLYGKGGKRWAFTERRRHTLTQGESDLTIGRSSAHWDGNSLIVHLDEVAVPVPTRIRGTVRLTPKAVTNHPITLDDEGAQRWWPIAPCAEIEVDLNNPDLTWKGSGYLDMNTGTKPLEESFTVWDWSRADLADGRAAILYEATQRNGVRTPLGFACAPDGSVEPFEPPEFCQLPRTFWRMDRATRVDPGKSASVTETLEDAPFYTRSVLKTHLLGQSAVAMHESLSLDKFDRTSTRFMLPWRNPKNPF